MSNFVCWISIYCRVVGYFTSKFSKSSGQAVLAFIEKFILLRLRKVDSNRWNVTLINCSVP